MMYLSNFLTKLSKLFVFEYRSKLHQYGNKKVARCQDNIKIIKLIKKKKRL